MAVVTLATAVVNFLQMRGQCLVGGRVETYYLGRIHGHPDGVGGIIPFMNDFDEGNGLKVIGVHADCLSCARAETLDAGYVYGRRGKGRGSGRQRAACLVHRNRGERHGD